MGVITLQCNNNSYSIKQIAERFHNEYKYAYITRVMNSPCRKCGCYVFSVQKYAQNPSAYKHICAKCCFPDEESEREMDEFLKSKGIK